MRVYGMCTGCCTVVGRFLYGCWTVFVLFLNGICWVGAVGNSTQRRVNHPACARVLAMHIGVGGVLGPFTCGFGAGVNGERWG